MKDGGQKLKLLYDLFSNVKFVITGSSSLELTGKTAKFLVGRIFSFYLWQFNFGEFINIKSHQLSNVYQERSKLIKDFIYDHKDFSLPKKDIFSKDFEKLFEEYAIWGGYPEVLKTDDKETKKIILKNIYDTYITQDIIELLKITDYSKFKKIVSLLAVEVGNLINYNALAVDSQSYFKEVKHFLSILEETFIVSLLRPFFTNKTSEIRKNPKVYFIDSGLRNYILNNFNQLSLRTDAGQLVENAVFFQPKIAENGLPIKYWRTLGGAEVDFIIENPKNLIPIELKYSPLKSPQISRGFRNFLSEYKPKKAIIFTKG
ncbi:MAG: ATP-binding protein, partial [Minisyncoccia bacterium]